MAEITVIATVFNEAKTIDLLLKSLASQTLKPREIIIVDGGSTDSTFEKLANWQKSLKYLKVYVKNGNRSVGRNFAISKAKTELIAITDAGCIADIDWLKNIISPFSDPTVEVVSGYYRGQPTTVFQKSLIPYVLVMPDQITTVFFPSTRSMAIRTDIFRKCGGFDESLWLNEDFAFANKLHQLGVKFTFVKAAIVNWLPRRNLQESSVMFFRFALGDILSDIFRPKVKFLLIRYLVAVYLFFVSAEIPALWPVFIVLVVIYLVWSVLKNYKYVNHIAALFWLPVLQLSSDLAVIFGTTTGFLYKIFSK